MARILIVDDEESFLYSTADVLRREGYDCVCASEGTTARNLLAAENVDLVIADIMMEGNAQLEFIKDLPRIADGVPVILVTGYPSLDTAIEAIPLPVVAYLIKPFELDELLDKVRTAVGNKERLRVRRMERALKKIANNLEEVGIVAGGKATAIGPNIVKDLRTLSDREWDILRLLRANQRVGVIAQYLHISPSTVRNHLKSIFQKLGVHSQMELIEHMRAIQKES